MIFHDDVCRDVIMNKIIKTISLKANFGTLNHWLALSPLLALLSLSCSLSLSGYLVPGCNF